jgi:large subunit ribosomal protein L23
MRPVLHRPILSEKSSSIESLRKYVFEVAPYANKIEIRQAVELRYNVKVTSVRTISIHPRIKIKMTGRSMMRGKTIRRKKAIITVAEGQTIDLLGEIDE